MNAELNANSENIISEIDQTVGLQSNQPRSKRNGRIMLAATVIIACLLLAIGIVPRMQRKATLISAAKAASTEIPIVNVANPQLSHESNLILPGTTQPIQEAAIAAQTNGYLNHRYVDIGDRVQAGQILAEISTPEIDQTYRLATQEVQQARQEFEQSRADLLRAKARLSQSETNLTLAKVSLKRWQDLLADGIVSRQEVDERQAAYDAQQADVNAAHAGVDVSQSGVNGKEANLKAKEANLQRVAALQSFQKITAPFSGIITARNVDVGALISAGNSETSWLFKIAQTNTLRTFIKVPQTYISAIKIGQPAEVLIKELPGKTFTGKIVRTSNALDETSRTLLIEVQLDNTQQSLLAGMYAEVKLSLDQQQRTLLIPTSALVINAQGTQVATVTGDQKIEYKKIDVGRDYGQKIEVLSGLNRDSQIITNPIDTLQEGTLVKTEGIEQLQAEK